MRKNKNKLLYDFSFKTDHLCFYIMVLLYGVSGKIQITI